MVSRKKIVQEFLKKKKSDKKKVVEELALLEKKDETKKKLEKILLKNNFNKKVEVNKKNRVEEKPKELEEIEEKNELEEEKFIFQDEPEEEKPKVMEISRFGLDIEANRREIPLEGEEREDGLIGDYNARLRRNETERERGSGFGVENDTEKAKKLYDSGDSKESPRNFYDEGGREKSIYSSGSIGDQGDGRKFIHDASDLEKKSEETTMGNLGIAETRRKGEDKNPYDNMVG